MVIFQYNLYIFCLDITGCLTNTVYAMDPNNSVIKRLWCINNVQKELLIVSKTKDVYKFIIIKVNFTLIILIVQHEQKAQT